MPPNPIAHATRMSSISIKYKTFQTIEIRISPANLISERKLIALVDKGEIRAATSGSTVVLANSVQLLFDDVLQKNIHVAFSQDMLSLDCQFVALASTGELNCRLQIPSSYQKKISGLAGNWVEGNPEADLSPPAAATQYANVNINDTGSIYIAFNNSFKVTQSQSLFSYEFESWGDINAPVVPELSPTPPLHKQANETLIARDCTGVSAGQCIFDARFSGDLTAALESARFLTIVRDAQTQLGMPMNYCSNPDIPYAKLTVTHLRENGELQVTGCVENARDLKNGPFKATCRGGNKWEPDWRDQKNRCCLPHLGIACNLERD